MIERNDRRRLAKVEKDWKYELTVKKEKMKYYGTFYGTLIVR